MKFYRLTPAGDAWADQFYDLSCEESDASPETDHTNFWVLAQLQDSSEALSAPEIQSSIRTGEEMEYPMGRINLALDRLVGKGFVSKEDWG